MIPYGRQDITQDDINAVIRVLQSDYLTQGPLVPQFEEEVARHVGADYAVAVNSATSALHIACIALNLGPGDYLWTTPITFVASANCALYCGASVDFVDIDPQTYNIDVELLKEKLEKAKQLGTLPKVVVAVHLCGQPCNMREIRELSLLYGFKIIEDASHAVGGKYLGGFIGNGLFSDITVFSFHPVKIITTAEGGMAVTNNRLLATRLALLRSHGITRNSDLMSRTPDGPWYYEQIDLGYNYRMTEIQAALGLSQLSRLESYVETRHKLSRRYNELLANFPIMTPWHHPDGYSGLHLYVIRLELAKLKKTHLEVFEGLRELGVGVNLHYIPVHLQPYYKTHFNFKLGDFPEAEKYYSDAISLPMYQGLLEHQQDFVVNALKAVLT